MKLENIGFYTLNDKRAQNVSISSDLQRCELILSDKCNFKCLYCRGVKNEFRGDMTLKDAKKTVDLWGKGKLKNIRFSGGEPTIWPNLIDLVKYTKSKKSIERIAISTNGSADTVFYKTLVEAGVNDFSISLDACCSSMANVMAGKNSNFENLINNIKYLSKLTYVTVGIVLTEINMPQISEIVQFSKSLGVSDIRIIPSAQYNKNLKINIDENKNYPILNYRVNNITLERHVRGLQYFDSRLCYLVLDDMAIVGGYHFPCIIYLREQGSPIGAIKGKSITTIRKERYNWMKNHDCQKDKICSKNCLDVCIDYNNRVANFKTKKAAIPIIDAQLFTKYTWEGAHISTIFGVPMRTDQLIESKGKIKPFAIGWCKGEDLLIKRKENQKAVMFEKDNVIWWNHLTNDEFLAIFC